LTSYHNYAAGPWWDSYPFSLEPWGGGNDKPQMQYLLPHMAYGIFHRLFVHLYVPIFSVKEDATTEIEETTQEPIETSQDASSSSTSIQETTDDVEETTDDEDEPTIVETTQQNEDSSGIDLLHSYWPTNSLGSILKWKRVSWTALKAKTK
jgi:hypothetical protein